MSRAMKVVKILTLKSGALVAEKCVVADGFFSRLKGLLGRDALSEGEGLWLRPCNDIHMWFMKFPIDVAFVESPRPTDSPEKSFLRVRSAYAQVRPWRFLPLRDGSASETLELPAGTLARLGIEPGDDLICLS
jgi:uncharacterized membrane protein (UPF0127 family)